MEHPPLHSQNPEHSSDIEKFKIGQFSLTEKELQNLSPDERAKLQKRAEEGTARLREEAARKARESLEKQARQEGERDKEGKASGSPFHLENK